VTRSHRLRLAVPAVAGALVATGLLAACSAGQLAATSLVVPAVSGAQASVTVNANEPDRNPQTITVSNATLDFPGPGGYKQGANAPVSLWIFNNTEKDITLNGVASDVGQVLVSTGAHSGAQSPCLSSARPIQPNPSTGAPTAGVGPSAGASGGASPAGPTGTPSNRASAKPTGSASPAASGSASASPSPSPSPSPTPAGSSEVNIQIKAFGCVVLNRDASQFLQIAGLTKPVGSGMTVAMVFRFSQAGNNASFMIGTPDAPVQVPVNVPASAGSRPPAGVTPGE
jgi:hypothetical protein